MNRPWARVVLGAVLSAAGLSAQTTQGLISGRVTSQDGASIANAEIRYENLETATSGAGRSNAAGYFALPLLPPGSYRLRVSADGFQPAEIQELQLAVSAFLDIPFRLRSLADVWEDGQYRSLILPGSRAVLNFFGPDVDMSRSATLEGPRTTRGGLESTISEVINPAQIQHLPLAGRDVYTTLVLQPGVTSETSTSRGIGVAVNGQRPSASNFLLDGVENNNALVTGPLTVVAPEAVQEYRISTNNFSAEYGRASGFLANAVTRAGTNQWRGTGYFNLKDERLNAADFARNLNGLGRSPVDEKQFGFQFGSPIRRDRLYQSAALEHLRSHGQDDPVDLNLPATRYLDFLRQFNRTSLINQLLTQFAPPPVASEEGQFVGTLRVSPPVNLRRTVGLERIDYLSKNGAHRLMGRIGVFRLSRPDFAWTPYKDFVSGLDQNNTAVAAGLTSNLRPSVTNEARFSGSGELLEFDRPRPDIPTLEVSDGGILLPGSLSSYGYRNSGRNFEAVNNTVIAAGRHVIKFGGGFLSRTSKGFLTFGRDGRYVFRDLLDLEDALPLRVDVGLDRLELTQRRNTLANYDREYSTRQFHLFAQDSFRVTPKLALNYGLRYEMFGAPRSKRGVETLLRLGQGTGLPEQIAGASMAAGSSGQALYDGDHNNFAGRFGITYSVNRSTLVRAAYGLFYDRPYDNLWQNIRNNGFVLATAFPTSSVDFTKPVSTQLPLLRNFVADPNFSRITFYQPGVRTPYVQSYFAGAQRELTESFVVELNASGSLGRKLLTTDILNREGSRPGISDPFRSRFNPSLQNLYYRANQGASSYHALSLLGRYRGRRVQAQVAYTYSHAIDNQSEILSGDFFDFQRVQAAPAPARPRSAFSRQFDSAGDRGNADFDQRHNLVFYSIWELPGRHVLTRNWRIAQLGAIRSGVPYTVFAAGEAPLINRRADMRGAGEVDRPARGGRILLERQAFATPAAGQNGNLGRNSFAGPGVFNVDLSVSRSFPLRWLGEGGRVTLRADAYNFFNHANLGNPEGFLGSPDFGVARYGRQELSSGFPALAPLREGARIVQLILRLEF